MAFKLTTDPSDAISNETGEAVVTGGTYAGAGTYLLNETGVPVTGGTTYALTAPATGDGAELHWLVELTSVDYVWTDTDEREPDAITGAGESLRTWTPAEDGTARFSLVITGDATVTTPTVAPHTGMVVIVAGSKNGAHLEIKPSGLHAHNAAGTQTAHIDGNEGVFVGGEFRTSDALAGQVRMADDALVLEGGAGPGIGVEPTNAIGYTAFPGIGPGYDGMVVSGGANADGSAGLQVSPTLAQIWGTAADGSVSQMYVTAYESALQRFDAAGNLEGEVSANSGRADMVSVRDGVERRLRVSGNGVEIGTDESGTFVWASLEGRLSAIEARLDAAGL